MPAPADAHTANCSIFLSAHEESSRQLQLDLHPADSWPYLDTVTHRLEIHIESGLAHQLMQRTYG
jgi:hypothetical protein